MAPPPPSDCGTVGDCGANYLPSLQVDAASLQFSAVSGGAAQIQFVPFRNQGGGVLQFADSVSFQTGADWLSVDPPARTAPVGGESGEIGRRNLSGDSVTRWRTDHGEPQYSDHVYGERGIPSDAADISTADSRTARAGDHVDQRDECGVASTGTARGRVARHNQGR
ncbi:MAG: hypothetical protein M3Y07_18490, partial [Acidobacteriota bacterium]|nr:hypothetical protein [Acidobacteriota bacterium]